MQNNFRFERFVNYQDLINTKQYIVKQGDTLFLIAEKEKIEVNDIMSLNKLSSTTIYPNQVLFLPNNKKVEVGYQEYITSKGDTIKTILAKTNIEYSEFEKLNKIMNLELVSNQVIKVKENHGKKVILVKDNEDLNSILSNYSITPLELLELNKHLWLTTNARIIVG